jgi:hypothetical protein
MVRARCNLWDHAAERRMNRCLTCHTFSEHLTATTHKGDRALVTARFNRQQ